MKATWDILLDKLLLHTHDVSDIVGITTPWEEDFTTIGGSGASITTTSDIGSIYRIFVDGLLLPKAFYSTVGNVITFTPAIPDGKIITVINL